MAETYSTKKINELDIVNSADDTDIMMVGKTSTGTTSAITKSNFLKEVNTTLNNHASEIVTNAENITVNADEIKKNTSNITQNTSNIDTNAENIARNTDDIAQNAEDIAQNKADIAELNSALSELTDSIPLIETGYSIVSCTANTISTLDVKFTKKFSSTPSITVTPYSTVPGTIVQEVCIGATSSSGFTIYAYRTNTSSMGVYWIAIE